MFNLKAPISLHGQTIGNIQFPHLQKDATFEQWFKVFLKTYSFSNPGTEHITIDNEKYYFYDLKSDKKARPKWTYTSNSCDFFYKEINKIKTLLNEFITINIDNLYPILISMSNQYSKEDINTFNKKLKEIVELFPYEYRYHLNTVRFTPELGDIYFNFISPLYLQDGFNYKSDFTKQFQTAKHQIESYFIKNTQSKNYYYNSIFSVSHFFKENISITKNKDILQKYINIICNTEYESWYIDLLKILTLEKPNLNGTYYQKLIHTIFYIDNNRSLLQQILRTLYKSDPILYYANNQLIHDITNNIQNQRDVRDLIALFNDSHNVKQYMEQYNISIDSFGGYSYSNYFVIYNNHINRYRNLKLLIDKLELFYSPEKDYKLCYVHEFEKVKNIDRYKQIYPYSSDVIKLLNRKSIILKNENNPILYGLELEVASEYTVSKLIDVAAIKDLFFLCKSDASITGNGTYRYEIVTIPMSLKAHRYYWAHMFSHLNYELFDTSTNTQNGLHLHIHKNNFKSDEHINRYLFFINRPDNYPAILSISERDEPGLSRYCGMITRKEKELKDDYITRIKHYPDRHIGTNCTWLRAEGNHRRIGSTLETRIFKGITSYNSMIKSIEFKDALIHYTLDNTSTLFNDFYNWLLNTSQYRYSTLKEFLLENHAGFSTKDICTYSKEYKNIFNWDVDYRPFSYYKENYIEAKKKIIDTISPEFFGKLIEFTRKGKFNNKGILVNKDKENEKKALNELIVDFEQQPEQVPNLPHNDLQPIDYRFHIINPNPNRR